MPVRQEDMDSMLGAIKISYPWKDTLASANSLFYQGKVQYEVAVNKYGKIIEILLRDLFRDLSLILPPNQRTNFVSVESQIGHGKPFLKFGLGDEIRFFLEAGLFTFLNSYFHSSIFDAARLNEINKVRISQTHYTKAIEQEKVDQIRKDVTDILIKLMLIENDSGETVAEQKPETTSDKSKVQKTLQQAMQCLVTKIRCGLLNESIINFSDEIINNDGYSASVWAKIDIAGVYLDKNKIAVIVRALDFDTPIQDDLEPAYEKIAERVFQTIAKIAPEAKTKLKFLIFVESEGEIEDSAICSFSF